MLRLKSYVFQVDALKNLCIVWQTGCMRRETMSIYEMERITLILKLYAKYKQHNRDPHRPAAAHCIGDRIAPG